MGLSQLSESLLIETAPCGMPDAIRTHDLQSRSLTLYPAELQAHITDLLHTASLTK